MKKKIFLILIVLVVLVFITSSPNPSGDTAWLKAIIEESTGDRVTINDITITPKKAFSTSAYKVSFSFKYRLPKGGTDIGKGSLYIPTKLEKKQNMKFPLHFQAGYSKNEGENLRLVKGDIVVSNPEEVNINPLALGPNRDIAMLHIVRSLPFIDDSKVGIHGGSAGGYVALMLTAESFPLSYTGASGAILNRGYNLSYLKNSIALADEPELELPVVNVTSHIVTQAFEKYTTNLGDIAWYNTSPISQIDTITSPVALFVSSADTLVPIDQVSADFIVPVEEKAFPNGFTSDLASFTTNKDEKLRLMDVLSPEQFEVLKIVPPEDLPIFEQMEYDLTANPPTYFSEMPFSKDKQWSIVVRDEGPKLPKIGHIKYLATYTYTDFNDHYREEDIKPEQLTPVKLERLMARYAGEKWLEDRFVSLDYPEAERKDVLRGLATFSMDPKNAEKFLELYTNLPQDKQLLDQSILNADRNSVHKLLNEAYITAP